MVEILKNMVSWIDEDNISVISTAVFWNDEDKEKDKPFYLLENNPGKLQEYLEGTTTNYEQYENVLKFARKLGLKIQGTGVDVASGVCWTTALLSKIESVEHIYAIDVSKHRLGQIAPQVFKILGAVQSKITRVLGSFYDIKLPDSSVNFCCMAQAFHHADNPMRLLKELHRILKPKGIVLVIGETPIYPAGLLKSRIKNVIKMIVPMSLYTSKPIYKFFPSYKDLFPTDFESGDHYYRISDYPKIFDDCGFVLYTQRCSSYTVFIAVRKD